MRQTGCETGYMTPTYGPRFTSGRTVLAVLPHLLRSYLLTCFLEVLLTYFAAGLTYLLTWLLTCNYFTYVERWAVSWLDLVSTDHF
jgi:hypothetical protein